MENGLAVKTSSEDSGEASKNDTPSGGSSDEMDVDGNNVSGAIPITDCGGHPRRRCSSNTSVSTSVTSGIGTCSSVEEVPEMDFIKELDSEDEFVQAKSHQGGDSERNDSGSDEQEHLKRKSSDSEGNLEDFSFLRVESNGSSAAKCSKTENGASSSSSRDKNNKCSPSSLSRLFDSKNGSKMSAFDALDNNGYHNHNQDQTINHKQDENDDDDDADEDSENPFDSPLEPPPLPPLYPSASSFYRPIPVCAPPTPPPRKGILLDAMDKEEDSSQGEPSGPTFRICMKEKVDLLPIPSALKNFLLFYRT